MPTSYLLGGIKFDQTEAQIILADLIGKDRSFLVAHPEYDLPKTLSLQFINRLKRRIRGEPLAYILGYKEFYGLKFLVDKRVLIPRCDTEELVESVIIYVNKHHKQKPIKICDVGTGSGCIAIALAKFLPKAKIFAIDIDTKALSIAKKNAKLRLVEGKITFLKGDLISMLPEKVDIIAANLPYIKTQSIKKLDPQIYKWEPKIALDGGPNGIKLYERLFEEATKYLKSSGKIFYEINGKVHQKSFK